MVCYILIVNKKNLKIFSGYLSTYWLIILACVVAFFFFLFKFLVVFWLGFEYAYNLDIFEKLEKNPHSVGEHC